MKDEEVREEAEKVAAQDRGTDLWTVQKILNNPDDHPWRERIEDVLKLFIQGALWAEQKIAKAFDEYCKERDWIDLSPTDIRDLITKQAPTEMNDGK